MNVNTIIPTANPINLLGHILPSKYSTKYFTDKIYNKLIGILAINNKNGCVSNQLYLIFPCNCKNVNTCARNPYMMPKYKLFTTLWFNIFCYVI